MQPISDQEPARTVVATHGAYRAAEEDADYLVSRGFPADRVSVRVRGLRLVRPRPASGAWLRPAVRGALVMGAFGAVLGLWVGGVVLSLPLGVALAAVAGAAVAAAAAGLGAGVGVQALLARVRCQTGIDVLQADRYDVAVDGRLADAARRLLSADHDPGPRSVGWDDPGNQRV